MNHDYTQLINNTFMSPTTLELKRISEDIMCMPLDTDADVWQKKLEQIAQEFRLSCRFCLMRIFQSRAEKLEQCTEDGFWLQAGKRKYVFWDIDMEHAESMLDNESAKYLAYMRALARMQDNPEEPDPLVLPEWKGKTKTYEDRLIVKAWKNRKVGQAQYVLTRKEAFRLGHMLAFDREEMEFFLMRVFDYEEGFRFDTSNDLIEAYGLQEKKSWLEVEKLKQDYAELTANIQKEEWEDRNRNWTRKNASAKLDEYVSDADFLEWLKTLAPGLDTGSRTARRIYRNLATECLKLYEGDTTKKTDLEDHVKKLLKMNTEAELTQELIWNNGAPSKEKCRDLATKLRKINYELANGNRGNQFYKDPAQQFWHVPTVTDKMSKFSVTDGPINLSMRVENLLYGTVQVEKSDILFLLWVAANLTWDKTAMDSEDVTRRLQDFQDICSDCLKNALLPSFYVPHLLERTMLMAIACNDTESYSSLPAKEYEKILNLEKNMQLKKADEAGKSGIREKEAGYHRHTEDEWLELVKLSRQMLEYTVDEFAEWKGVSEQSLNRYQNQFVKERKLKPFDRKKKRKKYLMKLEREGCRETVMENKKKTLAAAAEDKEKELQKWREMRTKNEEK